MRDIGKYRGQRKDGVVRAYGWLLRTRKHTYIIKDGLYEEDIVIGFSKNSNCLQEGSGDDRQG